MRAERNTTNTGKQVKTQMHFIIISFIGNIVGAGGGIVAVILLKGSLPKSVLIVVSVTWVLLCFGLSFLLLVKPFFAVKGKKEKDGGSPPQRPS